MLSMGNIFELFLHKNCAEKFSSFAKKEKVNLFHMFVLFSSKPRKEKDKEHAPQNTKKS